MVKETRENYDWDYALKMLTVINQALEASIIQPRFKEMALGASNQLLAHWDMVKREKR